MRDDEWPIGGSETQQSRKNGEEQRDWAVDRVREHSGCCMVRNGRRFQIDAEQGAVTAARGVPVLSMGFPVKATNRAVRRRELSGAGPQTATLSSRSWSSITTPLA